MLYAERFVSLWTDKHVYFGNLTANRVESQLTKLKKHLESVKCDLDKFIHHAMDKILEELYQSKIFVPTSENYGCQMRTSFGLPCSHELVMYVDSRIPLDSIDAFWRKLDLKPSISVEYGDLNVDHRMQRIKEICNYQPDHIKYNYLRRMEEITDPSTNLINKPSVKKNNNGHPKVMSHPITRNGGNVLGRRTSCTVSQQ
uniref:Protein FAR1-RELATED SEQUENCE n=1 Tax=Lactuca sativa TaxID=4236 RepID=A0A9R1UEQ6_LACSA|nr:hypothetical protein LSAT_V11C900490320 [Lactuca sativa]